MRTTPKLAATTLIALLMSSPIWADPDLIRRAQQLLANGNAKQAYMILIAEQDKLTGNVEFDYLLGVAALDSGKIDEAIIAFERVLAVQPNNAGAQLDLARAYFNAGSLDLSEGTFRKLKALNPPPAAMMAIDKYLAAIAERRLAARRIVSVWGEMAFGYDSNLTGVPNDFTTAIQQSFNLLGVQPTGNSVKRSAAFLGTGIGADLVFPISSSWTGYVGGDLRGRGYQHDSEFNSGTAEVRASAIWEGGAHQFRVNTAYNAFKQRGAAPGEPPPTNERRSALAGGDYRYTLTSATSLTFAALAGQTRFPTNNLEDFDSTILSLAWLTSFGGIGTPVLQFTAYGTRDDALNKLADGVTDKSKKVVGLRTYTQRNLTERHTVFGAVGYSRRTDHSAFARSTTVEFGQDKAADLTIGVNWRFKPSCNLRAQALASRNDSNIAIYDYTRYEVSSTIRCEFL